MADISSICSKSLPPPPPPPSKTQLQFITSWQRRLPPRWLRLLPLLLLLRMRQHHCLLLHGLPWWQPLGGVVCHQHLQLIMAVLC